MDWRCSPSEHMAARKGKVTTAGPGEGRENGQVQALKAVRAEGKQHPARPPALSTSPCEQPPPPPPPPPGARASYRLSSSVLPFSPSHLLCFEILPRLPKLMWNPAPQPKGSLGQRSQRARNHSHGKPHRISSPKSQAVPLLSHLRPPPPSSAGAAQEVFARPWAPVVLFLSGKVKAALGP